MEEGGDLAGEASCERVEDLIYKSIRLQDRTEFDQTSFRFVELCIVANG
jgi:hypothetical protein